MHKVPNPLLTSLLIISCIKVTIILVPDAPIGWPRAMAPPFTFTISFGIFSSLMTAKL